jgi:hypothetical protein
MTHQNPQFAFSYEFIITESELKAVEVPKQKRRKASAFRIANRLKETNRPSNSLFTLAVIIVSLNSF